VGGEVAPQPRGHGRRVAGRPLEAVGVQRDHVPGAGGERVRALRRQDSRTAVVEVAQVVAGAVEVVTAAVDGVRLRLEPPPVGVVMGPEVRQRPGVVLEVAEAEHGLRPDHRGDQARGRGLAADTRAGDVAGGRDHRIGAARWSRRGRRASRGPGRGSGGGCGRAQRPDRGRRRRQGGERRRARRADPPGRCGRRGLAVRSVRVRPPAGVTPQGGRGTDGHRRHREHRDAASHGQPEDPGAPAVRMAVGGGSGQSGPFPFPSGSGGVRKG
jgi:hypothetical protein